MNNQTIIEEIPITNEFEQNFIDYSAEVNGDRALPDARSGLKPVHRRILWHCWVEKINSKKQTKKCARIAGGIIGRWHPHGDTSVYEALVKLAQPWRMRYPIMDFKGNMGNVGGDGPAAMRYTEARLAKISEDGMLKGLDKNVVDFMLNYDDTEEEPVTLPAIFPNLLCNPTKGIGVAMATNFLPHNLNEVANAIFDYLNGKEPMLPGPDFPLGGVVTNKDDIPNIMRTGKGTVRIRANYEIEGNKIIFTSIPFGTKIESSESKDKTKGLLEELADLAKEKPELGIKTIRDECGKNSSIRIVVECKTTANLESVVKQIFSNTKFSTTESYNMVALVDKEPKLLNLKDCIEIYVNHNIKCIEREAEFDLKKAENRLHIVEGLLKALEDIDNVIALIKKSKNGDEAKENLISKYKFTEAQAKSILAIRLSSLAHLEKVEIVNEKNELIDKISECKNIISSKDIRENILKERLNDIVKKYGDKRRTELIQLDVTPSEKELETVVPEDCVVIVSQNGLIKRVPKNSFKVQRRNGKGVKNKDGAVLTTISTNTIDNLMIFTTKGKMYKLLVDKVPSGTNASKGVSLNQLINLDADEEVAAVTSLYRDSKAKYVVFVTRNGLIKKTLLSEYTGVKRNTGIIATKIKDGDSISNVLFLEEEDLILITKNGMGIHFTTEDIKPIGRVTCGVKSIKLDKDDYVLAAVPIHKKTDVLAIFTTNGHGKKINLDELPVQGRTGKGLKIIKSTDGNIKIATAAMVSDEDNLLLIGRPNSICISAKEIPLTSRTSLGNIMVKDSTIENVVKI